MAKPCLLAKPRSCKIEKRHKLKRRSKDKVYCVQQVACPKKNCITTQSIIARNRYITAQAHKPMQYCCKRWDRGRQEKSKGMSKAKERDLKEEFSGTRLKNESKNLSK